jgi:FAD/FMN-containing dehydrogenase
VSLPVSGVIAYRARAIEVAHARGVQVFETGLWVTPGLFSMTMTATQGGRGASSDTMQDLVDELLRAAQDAGGSMEYCHGTGLRLAHLMAREHGAGLDVLRAIKKALDPHNIMNPGKLGL